MALTEAEITANIQAINTQLLDLAKNPKPSYRVGEHSVSWSDYHARLLKQLELYQKMLIDMPAEEETLWRDW